MPPPRKEEPVAASAGGLLAFFPVIKHGLPPNTRRPLDTPAPRPRQKPLTAGRTNPPSLQPVQGAFNADFMRRVRPRGVAIGKRVVRDVVAAPGVREDRDEALTVEDLWRPGSSPPPVEAVAPQDNCVVCLQLKSHPVFYSCGHGHCYTCKPFRIVAVEDFMTRIYGDWDTSEVSYEWSGLTFPVVPSSKS
ncbi:hypothetical protein DFH06DRAFT_1353403 [Mycena polygramma]|nr:hypothetical protein DFH06DRAFT_1353403 [Mycena polygramma]